MERGILSGLAAFRWAAWAWMAAVTVAGRDQLGKPWLAIGLIGVALAMTVVATALLRTEPGRLRTPAVVVPELAIGAALVLCDGWAYGKGHAFATSQSLGVAWPLAGVLTAGVTSGPWAGIAAGTVMGGARVGAVFANGVAADAVTGGRVLSLASTFVLFGLAGAVSGQVANLLRRAETQISAARAREEVARTLHDGVLQTLAVVERRATDPELARLAREQERDLREWLFGLEQDRTAVSVGLGLALRAAAARFEDVYGGRAEVIVADDLAAVSESRVAPLAGAVSEALTNAGKHGGATRTTVYVEPDGPGLFCSVKDNGTGFDPLATAEGVGLSRSIRGRIEELGGRVEVVSRPGGGTEVQMWLR